MIKQKLFYLCLLLVLSSCMGSLPKKLDPKIYYAHDLKLKVNGHQSYGTIVVPKSDEYEIKIKSPGKMSLFILETCHREIPLEDIGKREKLIILPSIGVENEPDCSNMKIHSFDKKKGRHAWGMVLVENEAFTLPAEYKCNGHSFKSSGSAICQSKENKRQEIKFPVKVAMILDEDNSDRCKAFETLDSTTYYFNMPNRECEYLFEEIEEPHRLHHLLTIGYERYPIRE